ncbi:MAG: amidohydrolase [Pseudomonadota bacterium]
MSWKTWLVVFTALVTGVGVVLNLATRLPAPPAHQVFINAEVITLDDQGSVAEAVAVRGELIEAVGTTDEIMALVEDQTVVHDLRGRTLMPGFVDAHGHFPASGISSVSADLSSPPVGDALNIKDVLDALRVEAQRRPNSAVITGFGYDDTLLAEKRHPTRDDLDKVSTERPVIINHVSGHLAVANSAALALVGINADTPDPEGGVIQRREGSNEPNGVLEENAAFMALELSLDFSLGEIYALLKTSINDYASHGVTTAQSGGAAAPMMQGLSLASRLGMLPLRLNLFAFEKDTGEGLLNGEIVLDEYSTARVKAVAVKLVADGSIQGYTGYLSQPYHVPYKGDEAYRGYPTITRDVLFEKVAALHKAGFQLAIHGNGDQAIEDIIDAFEAAQAAYPVDDPRLILIHGQMAREEQVKRMKGLGITPSFFSAHTYFWGDRHREIFMGPARADAISPAQWAVQHGVRYSSHLDSPVVPMRPLQAVWSQVFRQTYGGDVLGPEQRVSVMQALRAVTIDAAWQVFQEDEIGSIEPGKLADLIVLSGSPLKEPMAMRDLKVDRTVVGGATIYRRQ